jgi:hypothetical protein
MEKRREEMLVVEIYDEGRNNFVVECVEVKSIKDFVEGLKSDYEGSEEEWIYEEKNGWVRYGFEGSEMWGICKEISEGEKEMYENMSEEELEELVDKV